MAYELMRSRDLFIHSVGGNRSIDLENGKMIFVPMILEWVCEKIESDG